ncbi:MAG: flagellar biosynthesis protein FlhF [Deltaproteobacteria bacterium]|nr:flagellar biosynthesis protein FlhF [Deltaproteobacteria bacterium]
MRIKRFVARNSHEALRKIRSELGPGAVVLGSRNLQNNSSAGGQLIEVTAAVDLDMLEESSGEAGGQDQVRPSPQWCQRLDQQLEELRDLLWISRMEQMLAGAAFFDNHLGQLYTVYRELGIKDGIIRSSLTEHQQQPRDGKGSRSDCVRQVLDHILDKIDMAPPSFSEDGQQIISFIGPTGVGKTTTMAKLAARTAFEQGKRVALVTVDQYRIGAIDQMYAYARIMKLPMETAANAVQLRRVLKRHLDKDVIFIDTTGRSPANQDDLAELAEIFRLPWPVEHQLVLSANTAYRDLLLAAAAFERFGYKGYLITKLDEACDGAELMNFLLTEPRPLSFFTTGQRVPEDIEAATRERLAAFVARGRSICALVASMNAVETEMADKDWTYGSGNRAQENDGQS